MSAVEEHKHAEKRRALGRGLDSLLPSGPRLATGSVPAPAVMPPPIVIPTDPSGEIAEIHGEADKRPHFSQKTREMGHPQVLGDPQVSGDTVQHIPLDLIDENPYQTRRSFDEAALRELADSIKESGLAQPVVLRPGANASGNANGRYVLVLGERRCRASRLAGKKTVPAIVRQLGNEQAAELTVIENLQRQDLNCLEQAQAFARLSRDFNLTQEQIGKRVGTSRESVANYMRLLKLPELVQELIGEGKLGFSEARVLLEALPHLSEGEIEQLAIAAAEGAFTVKQLKLQLEYRLNPELHPPSEPPKEKHVDPNVADAERRLREALGLRVQVAPYSASKGRVIIRYESVGDFDRILEMLGKD